MFDSIKNKISDLYQQFIKMDDSPQRIALGFGIGFFLGILPFTGVVAAIAVAWYFRLNKPAAILGSLLANTWLSVVLFGFSVQMSSWFLGLSIEDIRLKFQNLMKDFRWDHLGDPFFLKITGTVFVAFLILSLFLSLIAYGACLALVYWKKRSR